MDHNVTGTPTEFVSLISDVGFSSKIRSVAGALGRSSMNVRSFSAVAKHVGPGTKGIVVDLAHQEAPLLLDWLNRRFEGPLPVLAFYPHVEHALGDAARSFPFVQVTTRSKLDSLLAAFISALPASAS